MSEPSRQELEAEAKEAFASQTHPMKFTGNPGMREIAESWYVQGYLDAAIP